MTSDDRLLELIGDTHGLLELDEFRVELLAALHRAPASPEGGEVVARASS